MPHMSNMPWLMLYLSAGMLLLIISTMSTSINLSEKIMNFKKNTQTKKWMW